MMSLTMNKCWLMSWPRLVTLIGECWHGAYCRGSWWGLLILMVVSCNRESDIATVRTHRNQLCDWLEVSRPTLVVKVTHLGNWRGFIWEHFVVWGLLQKPHLTLRCCFLRYSSTGGRTMCLNAVVGVRSPNQAQKPVGFSYQKMC